MNRLNLFLVLLTISIITVPSCDDTVEPDDIPPEVYITYPLNNDTVSEIALITCMALDNDGIENVALYVDGYRLFEDGSEPFELFWNTISYETGTSHTIIVRASDRNGNKADSDPIVLVVDNSNAAPGPAMLRPIEHYDGTYHLSWTTSLDADFYSYTVFEALNRDMAGMTEIFSSTVVTDTTCVVDGIGSDDRRYYQVLVADSLGFETSGNIMMGSPLNIVAYYPLDGDAVDASGNELNGTVRSCEPVADRNGSPSSALFFDGTNDRVTFAEHPELGLTRHLTICFWMRPEGDTETVQTIINCQKWGESFDTNAPYSLSIPSSDSTLFYVHENSGGNNNMIEFTDHKFTTGEWTHVAIVRDINSLTVTLYINGVQVAVEGYANNPNGGSESRTVFGECGGCAEDLSFFGALDEIYFFNMALDATEILAIYEDQ